MLCLGQIFTIRGNLTQKHPCFMSVHTNYMITKVKETSSRYVFKRDLLTQTENPKEVTTYFFWFFNQNLHRMRVLINSLTIWKADIKPDDLCCRSPIYNVFILLKVKSQIITIANLLAITELFYTTTQHY